MQFQGRFQRFNIRLNRPPARALSALSAVYACNLFITAAAGTELAGASSVFFFQAEDGIRDDLVTGVQTCALPISSFVPQTAPPMQRP